MISTLSHNFLFSLFQIAYCNLATRPCSTDDLTTYCPTKQLPLRYTSTPRNLPSSAQAAIPSINITANNISLVEDLTTVISSPTNSTPILNGLALSEDSIFSNITRNDEDAGDDTEFDAQVNVPLQKAISDKVCSMFNLNTSDSSMDTHVSFLITPSSSMESLTDNELQPVTEDESNKQRATSHWNQFVPVPTRTETGCMYTADELSQQQRQALKRGLSSSGLDSDETGFIEEPMCKKAVSDIRVIDRSKRKSLLGKFKKFRRSLQNKKEKCQTLAVV